MENFQSFEKRVDTAAQLAWRSRMLFEVYSIYDGEREFSAIDDVLESHWWFFQLQAHANRFAAFVYLAGLFQADRSDAPPHKRTINLPNILEEAETNLSINASDAQKLRTRLNSQPNALKGIKLIRDKSLSHRDATIDLNTAFKQASITAAEVRAVSDAAIEVANFICRANKRTEIFVNVADLHRHAKKLFSSLGAEFPPEMHTSPFDELFGGR